MKAAIVIEGEVTNVVSVPENYESLPAEKRYQPPEAATLLIGSDYRIGDQVDAEGNVIPAEDPDPAATLAAYKGRCIEQNRASAGSRIAVLFGVPDGGAPLVIRQLNALARVAVLQDKQIAGQTLTQDEEDELQALRQLNAAKDAVRDAENAAAALIEAAGDLAGVEAVKAPAWPGEGE